MKTIRKSILKITLLSVHILLTTSAFCQDVQSKFNVGCKALQGVVAEAGNSFHKTKANFIRLNNKDSIWAVQNALPGAVSAVLQNRHAYICIMYDGPSLDSFKLAYNSTLDLLEHCLDEDDYEALSIGKLGDPVMGHYPDVQYRTRTSDAHAGHNHKEDAVPLNKGKEARPVIILYVAASHNPSQGSYKVQLLIHEQQK